jgi:hypothetical protein
VAERLLGRDVVRRAEHAPVRGQALLVERAGDAEVGDLAEPSSSTRTFWGLTSRWTMPRSWAAPSARAISIAYAIASATAGAEAADALLERLAVDVLEDDVRDAVAAS